VEERTEHVYDNGTDKIRNDFGSDGIGDEMCKEDDCCNRQWHEPKHNETSPIPLKQSAVLVV